MHNNGLKYLLGLLQKGKSKDKNLLFELTKTKKDLEDSSVARYYKSKIKQNFKILHVYTSMIRDILAIRARKTNCKPQRADFSLVK